MRSRDNGGYFIPGCASTGDEIVLAVLYNVTKNISVVTETQELLLVLAAYVFNWIAIVDCDFCVDHSSADRSKFITEQL